MVKLVPMLATREGYPVSCRTYMICRPMGEERQFDTYNFFPSSLSYFNTAFNISILHVVCSICVTASISQLIPSVPYTSRNSHSNSQYLKSANKVNHNMHIVVPCTLCPIGKCTCVLGSRAGSALVSWVGLRCCTFCECTL